MADDLLASLVHLLAELGHEVGTQLSDQASRAALMARSGLVAPAGAPPATGSSLTGLDGLRSGGSNGSGTDTLQMVEQLGVAMIDLVAFVQEATQVQDGDDAWNLVATYIDLVALDMLRSRRPESW
jgi:hypothetical protein